MNLTDRVTIVTGATRGIGRAIAIECAKAGSHVSLFGRNESLRAEAKAEVEALGRRALTFPVDVASAPAVEEAIKKTHQEFSRIDCLVNNAGITRDNLLLMMKPEEWNDVLQTNLYGVFHCSKAVLRPMM